MGTNPAPVTGFEGCEKKLELDFIRSCDLRTISRPTWDSILTEARCTIIGETKNKRFDSYILSESSLFVFPHKIIIKTCGTTRLLHCLPKLLKATKEIGTSPEFVQYSRANFIFPEQQPMPHRSFSMEVKMLNAFFPNGQAYVLGPVSGPRWHLYVADIQSPLEPRGEQTLELIMFSLDRDVMRQFYNGTCNSNVDVKGLPTTGAEATTISGIDKLIPGSTIDSHLFTPCGYSCNGLKGSTYFTIHITPEPQCSFVSFETNLPVKCYDSLIRHVLQTFKPGNFCMSLFVDKRSPALCSQKSIRWNYKGYNSSWQSYQHFGVFNVTAAHFVAHDAKLFKPMPCSENSTVKEAEIPSQNEFLQLLTEIETSHAKVPDAGVQSFEVHDMKLRIEFADAKKLDAKSLETLALVAVRERLRVDIIEESAWVNPEGLLQDVVKHEQPEQAFFVVNVRDIVKRYCRWMSTCPRLEPFYQVRCNSDPGVLLALNALGCGFVCSSLAEVKALLVLGIPSTHIDFSNPWKPESEIRFARDKDLAFMSFDNVAELRKLTKFAPQSRLLLHIEASSSSSSNGSHYATRRKLEDLKFRHVSPTARLPQLRDELGRQHGAPLEDVQGLLEEAKRLNANLVGVSFQIDLEDSNQVAQALKRARWVFAHAKKILGVKLSVLDIGGGFPDRNDEFVRCTSTANADDKSTDGAILASSSLSSSSSSESGHTVSFDQVAEKLSREVEAYFPEHENVRVIARPARFLINTSHLLAVSVVSRRKISSKRRNSASSISSLDDVTVRNIATSTAMEAASTSASTVPSLFEDSDVPKNEYTGQVLPPIGVSSETDSDHDSDVDFNGRGHQRQTALTVDIPSHEYCSSDDTDNYDRFAPYCDHDGQKRATNPVDSFIYYLNDGLCGSFNYLLQDEKKPVLRTINKPSDAPKFSCSVFGQTIDGLDCLTEQDELPELFVGDWLFFQNMGACTVPAPGSSEQLSVRYVCSIDE